LKSDEAKWNEPFDNLNNSLNKQAFQIASSTESIQTSLFYSTNNFTNPFCSSNELNKMTLRTKKHSFEMAKSNEENTIEANRCKSTSSIDLNSIFKLNENKLKLEQQTSSSSFERSQVEHAENCLLSKKQQKRPQSQETIIEECKNSLNELIKASKWSTIGNSKMKIDENEDANEHKNETSVNKVLNDEEQFKFEQILSNELSALSSKASSCSSLLTIDLQHQQQQSQPQQSQAQNSIIRNRLVLSKNLNYIENKLVKHNHDLFSNTQMKTSDSNKNLNSILSSKIEHQKIIKESTLENDSYLSSSTTSLLNKPPISQFSPPENTISNSGLKFNNQVFNTVNNKSAIKYATSSVQLKIFNKNLRKINGKSLFFVSVLKKTKKIDFLKSAKNRNRLIQIFNLSSSFKI
jgi:hypothetical protein